MRRSDGVECPDAATFGIFYHVDVVVLYMYNSSVA